MSLASIRSIMRRKILSGVLDKIPPRSQQIHQTTVHSRGVGAERTAKPRTNSARLGCLSCDSMEE